MTLSFSCRGDGIPVTFVHGFTQTGQAWMPLLNEMNLPMSAILIDAPGHGHSIDGTRSLTETATDIAEVMPDGILVGYSMGARMALHTALMYPGKVAALVLISGTAGLEDETERQQRRESDTRLASRIHEIGVPAFLDEWLALPLFSGISNESAQVEDRLRNEAQGLADSLLHAGTGTQMPLWTLLSQLEMPVLLVAGGDDPKFVAIAERMHQLIRGSQLWLAPGAGHSVHLEQPTECARVLQQFIASCKGEK